MLKRNGEIMNNSTKLPFIVAIITFILTISVQFILDNHEYTISKQYQLPIWK